MAEPVIIPVQLEVTDIDMSSVNLTDVQKDISTRMSGIKKSIQDGFKGIDASAINKPIEAAMTSVKKSLQAAEDAQLRYNEALIRAGKSSQEYKSTIAESDAAIKNQEALVNQLSQLGPVVAPQLAEAKRELDALIEARNKINPLDFVDKAEPIQLEKVANAYQKVLSAMASVDRQSEKFNQTVQDNRLTDEYNEYLKQAEKYKTKLEELDMKSKRMEALGATDKQWEALRYDTEQVSSAMDDLIKKMRTAVSTGKAFRFGDGPKQDLRNQIQSFAMSSQNRAGYIQDRAMRNESPYTADYQTALNNLDKLEKKVEKIREKSEKMFATKTSKGQLQNLAYEAEKLDLEVDEAKNNIMAMVNEGKAFKFGNGNVDAEMGKIRDKSNGLQSTLAGVATSAKQAQGGLTAIGATHPKLAAILTVASKVAGAFGKVLKVSGQVASTITRGFVTAAKAVGKVANVVGNIAKGFANLGKKVLGAVKNINLFGKSSNKAYSSSNAGLKKLARNFITFGLGFRTLYYFIKRLRTIFVDSMKLMGEQFDEVGKPMTQMIEAFNRLKGSLATAFQPIVSVVMPILTRLMNRLSSMLETIGKFTATLTGQGYIYKTVAKNISSVAKAAKNANKELGSYDKLEVIKQNDLGYDYEKQDIGATENAASNFANMVKEAWKKADFTGVGQFVTEKLLEVLDKVEKNIVPKVTDFVNRLVKSVSTFLEGFDATAIGDKIGSIFNALVYGIDWAQVGELFANLNNTVWGFVDGLVNNIDWAAAGSALSTGVTSMFDSLKLDSLVGAISGLANGITTFFYNAISGVDWLSIGVQLGNAVNNLFNNIDLASIGVTINTLFNSLMNLISGFFATVDWGQLATDLATGINNIFSGDSSAFDSVTTSLNNAITTFVVTAIETIDWERIFDALNGGLEQLFRSAGESMTSSDNPLIAAFGSVFTAIADSAAILGPLTKDIITMLEPLVATILTEAGRLLPPLIEFTAEFTRTVLPVIVEIIKQLLPVVTDLVLMLLPVLSDILTALQPVFDVIVSDVLPIIVDLIKILAPIIVDIIEFVLATLLPLLPEIAELLKIISPLIQAIIDVLDPIFKAISALCDLLTQTFEPALSILETQFPLIQFLVELLIPVLEVLADVLEWCADKFIWVADVASDILIPAIKLISSPFVEVKDSAKAMSDGIKSAFDKIKDAANSLKNSLKSPINATLGVFESLANGIIKAVNSMVKGMNKLSFDVPDWVPGLGGKSFGFNLKEISTIKIPRLAQGAVIPPNKEFLAMLGDQRSGTNIEAPLDTIKQALAEVLAEVGGGSREPIILQVNGRVLAKVVWDEQEKRYKQTGQYSMA